MRPLPVEGSGGASFGTVSTGRPMFYVLCFLAFLLVIYPY